MRYQAVGVILFGMLLPVGGAMGQASPFPPFFRNDGTAYDAEISVVTSGALSDMQAVVSDDRKYVTINARVSNSQASLQQFSFQRLPARGFVGSRIGSGGNMSPVAMAAAAEKAVLDRPGTVLLSPR